MSIIATMLERSDVDTLRLFAMAGPAHREDGLGLQ
jgi:hypothetical protein